MIRSLRFLVRLAADPILRADNDTQIAKVKALASSNLALRATNGNLSAQVIAKQQGIKTLQALLEIHKDAGAAKSERIEELQRQLTAVQQDLARAQRRWDSHAYGCERAQRAEAEDASKRASDL